VALSGPASGARPRSVTIGRREGIALVAAAILAAYVVTRVAFIARFPYFLDEGTYAVFTYKAANSLHDLFISYTIAREPLMFWLGIPWVKLGFNPLDAVRIVSAMAGLMSAVFIGLVGRRLGGTYVGLTAAGLYVVLPFFVVHDGIGIIEPLVTLAMASALYFQVELARRPDLRVAALLGLALAAGVLTKENTRPALALIPLSLLCFDWSPADRPRRLTVWLEGIGIALVMAAAAYVLLRTSSRYPDFEKARENPLLYTVRPLGDVLRDPFGAIGPAWSAYRPAFAGYVTLPLLATALAGAVLALRRHRGLALILLAWIFVPFTVAMLFSTAPFPRHVMYLLPPGIVLAAFALVEGVQLARRLMPARRAAVACVLTGLLLLAPALRLDLRILAHPDTARYPGLDDLQYVTGTGGGTVWPPMADLIRSRARGDRVYILSPTAYTQVLEMLLGPSPRYVTVDGLSPLASRAQFAVNDEIPFLDGTAAAVVEKEQFVPIQRFTRPRGGATATLLQRPDLVPGGREVP
jgi:4-amino-4-deoxy-L-arabinose transferase-like glycosyltransferase